MSKWFAIGAAVLVTAIVAIGAATASAGNGSALNDGSANALTLAVFGDEPYGTSPGDTSQFAATPAFIDAINSDPHVRLVLQVGDIHSGKQFCTEAYDRSVFDLWTAFKDPLVYTPGDNEWSDCHKKAQGGGKYNPATHQIDYVLDANGDPVDYAKGDPIANLDLVRSIFFSVIPRGLRRWPVAGENAMMYGVVRRRRGCLGACVPVLQFDVGVSPGSRACRFERVL